MKMQWIPVFLLTGSFAIAADGPAPQVLPATDPATGSAPAPSVAASTLPATGPSTGPTTEAVGNPSTDPGSEPFDEPNVGTTTPTTGGTPGVSNTGRRNGNGNNTYTNTRNDNTRTRGNGNGFGSSGATGATSDRSFGRVASGPQSPPNPLFATKPMSPEFAVLNTRSIFQHGPMPIDRTGVRPGGDDPRPPQPPAARPEEKIIFNGAARVDNQVVALLEDVSAQPKFLKLKVGDAVANGKITSITLEKLGYTPTTGKPVMVEIGRNLDNADAGVAGLRPTPVTAGASSSGPSSGPAGTPGSVNPGTLSVLERLRLKRLQETGGGPPAGAGAAPGATTPGSTTPGAGAPGSAPGATGPNQ